MLELMQMQIRRWIREAWAATNNDAPLTPIDHQLSIDLSETAAKQIRRMREQRGMMWQEAWSEIAPEFLSIPQPSVQDKAQATS